MSDHTTPRRRFRRDVLPLLRQMDAETAVRIAQRMTPDATPDAAPDAEAIYLRALADR